MSLAFLFDVRSSYLHINTKKGRFISLLYKYSRYVMIFWKFPEEISLKVYDCKFVIVQWRTFILEMEFFRMIVNPNILTSIDDLYIIYQGWVEHFDI